MVCAEINPPPVISRVPPVTLIHFASALFFVIEICIPFKSSIVPPVMFKVLLKETSPVNITTFPLTVALPNASLNAAAEPTSTAPPLTEQSSPTIKTIQPINPLFLFILLSLYFLFRHARNVVSKFILGRKQVETPFILCFPRESSRKRCFLLLPERIVARNTVSGSNHECEVLETPFPRAPH